MEAVRVETLRLFNFRNYADQEVSFAPGVNILWGDNAQGKTNLLEAVFYFGGGKSYRAHRDAELIRFGQAEGLAAARVWSGGRTQALEARFFAQGRRGLYANGVKLSSPRDMVGRLPCVLFGPEELGLIREGAAARRRFMDLALCQLRPRYLSLLAEYNRLHAHKTRVLRDGRMGNPLAGTLPDFNRRLAQTGGALTVFRAAFIARVAAAAAGLHADVTEGRERLALSYRCKPVWSEGRGEAEQAEALYESLCAHETAEWAAGRCLVGPHKDDAEALLDGVSARDFGSQGQARTAALAMKLAERQVFTEEFGAYPVLLLDDVLSELDPGRQDYVLHKIEDGQVLITCCEPARMTTLKGGRAVHIVGGRAEVN
ncbi:MAG: DNA replication/repair protein RecF [Oscillospiraceae bacterium]|jgi:DNA replication and repair protein RecF|nr:DNA replication/repair protein RecF [Oscillospiraceae bacterium]